MPHAASHARLSARRPLIAGCLLLVSLLIARPAIGDSAWVQTGVTGRLVYVPDAEGDRILDFSGVGYRGQGVEALPEAIPTVVTVTPTAGDDTASIQAAINQVAAMPLGADGYRGAVELGPGVYDIDSQLEIRASGVVLRGAGAGVGGTVLHGRNPLTGGNNPNQRPLVRIYGNGSRSNTGSTSNLIDKVVPAGSRSFRVDTAAGLNVGDTVRIERPSTQAWIDALGMDNPPNNDPPWQPGSMNVRYDRVITRIEGNRVFVDAPLANSFDQQYGGGTLRRYSWSGAIENVGIENLRGDSDFDGPTDEDHAWEFIEIGDGQNSNRAQHVWVRNITATHFGDSAVLVNPGGKWVTVENAVSEMPVSQITGSRRYTYDLSGELSLVANSEADSGRHDFVNNSTRPAGPNVFWNSTATNALNDSGPHQRWATGTLFDNIAVEGDAINVRNRGSFGTAHGWSGANMVIWNSEADSFRVQNPPTAKNWLVGSTGAIVEDTTFGPQPSGYYDSHGTPVVVGGETSLYAAQRNDARDIRVFHFGAGDGPWLAAESWVEQVAPLDVYAVSLRDYLQGDIDDYVDDGPGSVDRPAIDPAWEAIVTGSSSAPVVGFDSVGVEQNVAWTIDHTLDAGEQVVHASLALALRAADASLEGGYVRIAAAEHLQGFDELGWDASIETTGSFVGVLDLGALLPDLQSGAVGVHVHGNTGLDWGLYTATVATPRGTPHESVVWIESGATATLDNDAGVVGTVYLGGAGAGRLALLPTGRVEVASQYVQTSGGELAVTLAGSGSTGVISVAGEAVLAGTLSAELALGLMPAAGDSWVFLDYANRTGAFNSLSLPELDAPLAWHLEYDAQTVALLAVYSADFTFDGVVDGTDLTLWQQGFGSAPAEPGDGDADRNGLTAGNDLLVWQRQLGSVAAAGASVEIPEPSSGFLVLGALASMVWCNRRVARP